MVNNNETVAISNVYIPNEPKKKEWLDKAIGILGKKPKAILIGDLNTKKKEVSEHLSSKNIMHKVCEPSVRETRKVKGEETDKTIDFMITNSESLN